MALVLDRFTWLALGATLFATSALADGSSSAADGPQSYSLSNPTPPDKLRPLCTDRPTKSNGPCTVDAGHFQVESDVLNVTFDRSGGVDTDTYLYINPTLKLGVTPTIDLELNWAPLETVTTQDRSTGAKSSTTGVGDLFLLAKINLIGDDGGDLAIALRPSIKLPTAPSGIGNGAVEGSLIVPTTYNLGDDWSLSFAPELDLLKNSDDSSRHVNFINLVGLNRTIGQVTAQAELWSDLNFDPAGTARQYSFDAAAAWIPSGEPNLQLDCGVNIGLNGVTPGLQAYTGISRRF